MEKDQENQAEMRQPKKAETEKPAKGTLAGFPAWGTGAPKPQVIAEHTVGGGDTLGHIALKYYGHATEPYWRVIYEANKALIGDDPNKVKRGITLKIPELPADLKK